jgi:hypothetical protein
MERELYSIEQARALLGGIARNTFYDLLRSGALASVPIGRRRFISARATAGSDSGRRSTLRQRIRISLSPRAAVIEAGCLHRRPACRPPAAPLLALSSPPGRHVAGRGTRPQARDWVDAVAGPEGPTAWATAGPYGSPVVKLAPTSQGWSVRACWLGSLWPRQFVQCGYGLTLAPPPFEVPPQRTHARQSGEDCVEFPAGERQLRVRLGSATPQPIEPTLSTRGADDHNPLGRFKLASS